MEYHMPVTAFHRTEPLHATLSCGFLCSQCILLSATVCFSVLAGVDKAVNKARITKRFPRLVTRENASVKHKKKRRQFFGSCRRPLNVRLQYCSAIFYLAGYLRSIFFFSVCHPFSVPFSKQPTTLTLDVNVEGLICLKRSLYCLQSTEL